MFNAIIEFIRDNKFFKEITCLFILGPIFLSCPRKWWFQKNLSNFMENKSILVLLDKVTFMFKGCIFPIIFTKRIYLFIIIFCFLNFLSANVGDRVQIKNNGKLYFPVWKWNSMNSEVLCSFSLAYKTRLKASPLAFEHSHIYIYIIQYNNTIQ